MGFEKKINEAKDITYFSTNLVSTLTSLHMNNFTHFCFYEYTSLRIKTRDVFAMADGFELKRPGVGYDS